MKRSVRVAVFAVAGLLVLALPAFAGPKFINFQGVLENDDGPIEDATVHMTFRLYNVPELGDIFWEQEITDVETKSKGKFSVKLGKAEGQEIPDSVFLEEELWLGIQIIDPLDPQTEMTPRTEIGAVPFALMAKMASDVADTVIGSHKIKKSAIVDSLIASHAVDSSKIGANAVDSNKIADNAVDSLKIKDKSIRKENIKDKAVGKAQLDTLSIDSTKIIDKGIRLKNLAQEEADDGEVMKWSDYDDSWIAATDATSGEGYWTLLNSALFTSGEYGLARGGNYLHGLMWQTHVNLGVACTTGVTTAEYIYCTVSGGYQNSSNNRATTVGGGESNEAAGRWSAIPGGLENGAIGDASFAAGTLAKALHTGSVVIAANDAGVELEDALNPADSVYTTGEEQMVLRADGGFYLTNHSGGGTIGPNNFLRTSTGALLTKTGIWSDYSDRNAKENFTAIDRRDLLEKIAALPITRWNFKIDDDGITHIGPMAQDFQAIFGVGHDDKSIATLDEAGIALAAIQELYEKTRRIEKLEAQLEKLQKQVEKLMAENK